MKYKILSIVMVLSLVGCKPNTNNGYKAAELLKNAQESIILQNKAENRIVFRNEQLRTKDTYSVACGEYGIKKSALDRDVTFNRYVIFEKDKVILEISSDKSEFEQLWSKNCIG